MPRRRGPTRLQRIGDNHQPYPWDFEELADSERLWATFQESTCEKIDIHLRKYFRKLVTEMAGPNGGKWFAISRLDKYMSRWLNEDLVGESVNEDEAWRLVTNHRAIWRYRMREFNIAAGGSDVPNPRLAGTFNFRQATMELGEDGLLMLVEYFRTAIVTQWVRRQLANPRISLSDLRQALRLWREYDSQSDTVRAAFDIIKEQEEADDRTTRQANAGLRRVQRLDP
jgi:hypothetical protein